MYLASVVSRVCAFLTNQKQKSRLSELKDGRYKTEQ